VSEPVKRCLVAYGNQLRADDGAAWELARRASELGWITFCAIQLLPELSTELQAFDEVIFTDACEGSGKPGWTALEVSLDRGWPVHCGRPEQLLGMCRQLYGRAPKGWMLSLPGENFGYGSELSPRAEVSIGAGLGYLLRLPSEPLG
jgi:Ni,Fe-hydrogenase maturation factor